MEVGNSAERWGTVVAFVVGVESGEELTQTMREEQPLADRLRTGGRNDYWRGLILSKRERGAPLVPRKVRGPREPREAR
jgi:hypothetical protein